MCDIKAYRCLVDRERFAIIQAEDVLTAKDRFRELFPVGPFMATPIIWFSQPGDQVVQVVTRRVPLP